MGKAVAAIGKREALQLATKYMPRLHGDEMTPESALEACARRGGLPCLGAAEPLQGCLGCVGGRALLLSPVGPRACVRLCAHARALPCALLCACACALVGDRVWGRQAVPARPWIWAQAVHPASAWAWTTWTCAMLGMHVVYTREGVQTYTMTRPHIVNPLPAPHTTDHVYMRHPLPYLPYR